MKRIILLVAKDSSSLTALKEAFSMCGVEAHCAKTQDIYAAFSIMNYSLVILKAEPVGEEDLNAISWLQKYNGIPMVVISSVPSKGEEVTALNQGTDQYWGFPMDDDILKARLQALLRRYETDRMRYSQEPDIVAFGCGLSVNTSKGMAFWQGSRINLRPTPLSILVVLAANVGKPVKKEMLYDRIWKGSYNINADEVLKHHISQLRKKLRELGADDLIKTVWGVGYMLRNEGLLE